MTDTPPQRRGLALNLMATEEWGSDSFAGILDSARLADAMGVDRIVLPDHVSMSERAHRERDGFPYPLSMNWHDPIPALAAIAAVTTRVRLGMNVLIAPLRPATLLATQLATLDAISGGRVEASFGVGWQREEYDAGEREFDGRFGMLEEQIEVCRALWADGGATHNGRRIRFDDLHSYPKPPQGADLPIHLGVALSPRNLERIVRLADGWAPAPMPAADLKEAIDRLRSASEGRPTLRVTAATTLYPHGVQKIDRAEVLDEILALWDAGADTVIAQPRAFCRTIDELEGFVEPLLAARDA